MAMLQGGLALEVSSHSPGMFAPGHLESGLSGAADCAALRGGGSGTQSGHGNKKKNEHEREGSVHDRHFVSQATPLAVQNMPDVFPDMPNWHIGNVGSLQSVLPAHMVVQAAKIRLRFEQLKHVVPDAHGIAHSAAKVVQMPCRHVTPDLALNWIFDPSSVVGCPSAQPHAGYVASHFGSRSW